tara:strand:+ start:8471 stop:11203 length:2733 start_codon:yes stop_codon:yes gene_type:complete
MKKMLRSVIIFGSLSVGMGQTLYINEVMAKQGAHDDCLWYDCSDFFEIFNPGTEAVDIGGWYVTDDLNNPTAFQLSDAEPEVTTVQPGGFLLIFADKHPTYGPLHVSFGLSSGGESVALVQPDGSFMDSLSFGEWPVDTSFGRSPDGGTTAGTLVDNWEWYYKPSPGRSNITVRINEFLAKNDNVNQDENGNFSDWVELYNYGESDVDIGGMSMTDDYTTPTQYTIPSGTTIPAGEFLLVWCDGSEEDPVTSPDVLHAGFKLSAGGDAVGLFYDNGGITVAVDSLTFDAQTADVSYGRYPDAADNWQTFSLPTPGSTNEVAEGPNISDVIREPMFPEADEAVSLSAMVMSSASNLTVELNYDPSSGSYSSVSMVDDGQHNDGSAGDGVYGGTIPAQEGGVVVYWYIHASDDAPSESVYPISAPGEPNSYRVTDWVPIQEVDLPVREPSGLAYNANSGTLFTHNDDNNANIYEISTSGEVLDSLMVGGNDFEGIAFNSTYDTIYVVEETTWEIVKYTLDGTKVGSISVTPDASLTDGLEGITIDHSTGHIFVLQEKNPSKLIELDAGGNELARTTLTFSADVSGISIHPTWGTLFIVSDQGYSLNEVSQSGEHLRSWFIPLNQAEGVTFASETVVYMVSDRGNKFYEFDFDKGKYIAPIPLKINEFLTSNDACCTDENGDFDDFLEIYNPTTEAVDIGGWYMTDNLSKPTLWQIPDGAPESTTIASGGFLLIWCDGETDQGVLHADFKLGKGGEQIGLYNSAILPADTLTYTGQTTDISYGRYPDGSDRWKFFDGIGGDSPTPGISNTVLSLMDGETVPTEFNLSQNFPNPFNPVTVIRFDLPEASYVNLKVYNLMGQEIRSLVSGMEEPGVRVAVWDGKDNSGRLVSTGVYLYRIKAGSFFRTHKMILLR